MVLAETYNSGIGLGTWPDWIAAIGTVVAFLIAAVAYATDANRRRWAQARLVYSFVAERHDREPGQVIRLREPCFEAPDAFEVVSRGLDGTSVRARKRLVEATIAVHNGSKELIGPIRARVVGMETPGEVVFRQVTVLSPAIGSTVSFRDSVGRWWRRPQGEPVERLNGPRVPTD